MATIDIKKLENRTPTSLVKYAFMDQRSSNIRAMASPGLGFMGGHPFQTWYLPAVSAMVTQQWGAQGNLGVKGVHKLQER